MTIDAIRARDILGASLIDDLDAALLPLQVIAGIDAGDVAGQVFAGFDWKAATRAQRLDRLRVWIAAERANLSNGAGPFTVENYAALHFLLHSLEELGFSEHLPQTMNNARHAMAALRKAYPLADQYAQTQKRKIG
ncbi:MAG: hypothetical protein AB7O46_00200 [Xanthobacteraceae bacterium]